MFLAKEDLGSVIYAYQIDQITEGNDDLVAQALAAAEEEAKSYLSQNINKLETLDGRIIYDVAAIFGASALDRNSLILQHCLTLAKFHIATLCNADFIYEQAKERYDRAIDWFTKLSKGTVVLTSLPKITLNDTNSERQPFSAGSRSKFNHDY
jgi:phage gp36-like protein